MAYNLTRRLLRDWKHLMRGESHMPSNERLFYLKPQDSNLHIWHLVLVEPHTSSEIYFVLYITDALIKTRCLTPNDYFSFNKNINITHMGYILKSQGFKGLIMKLWNLSFESVYYRKISNFKDNHNYNNNFNQIARLQKAWNRIIYKEFRILFSELVGFLQPGDYEMVKNLSRKLNGSCSINKCNSIMNESIFLNDKANEACQEMYCIAPFSFNKNNINNNNLVSMGDGNMSMTTSHNEDDDNSDSACNISLKKRKL